MVLNVDLPATFLDWAGLKPPARLRGPQPRVAPRGRARPTAHAFLLQEHLDLAPTLTWEGVAAQRYVYARYFDQEPVYEFLHDLQSDPDELENLATDLAHADALTTMRSSATTRSWTPEAARCMTGEVQTKPGSEAKSPAKKKAAAKRARP